MGFCKKNREIHEICGDASNLAFRVDFTGWHSDKETIEVWGKMKLVLRKAWDWIQTFILRTPDKLEYRRFLEDGGDNLLYELPEFESSLLVLDVGAYHGEWALKIWKKFGSKIHAYEPHPDSFGVLQANLGDLEEVTLFNKGLGHPRGLVELSDDENSSSLYRKRKGAKTFSVEIIDIAKVVADAPESEVGLMKMNVEGAEYDILRRLIDQSLIARIGLIQIQWHHIDSKSPELKKHLTEKLKETHAIEWSYGWTWELWKAKDKLAKNA